jgi:hypothetical protein
MVKKGDVFITCDCGGGTVVSQPVWTRNAYAN